MPVLINVDRFENPVADNVLVWDMYIKVKTGGSRTLDKVYSQSKCYFKYLRYGLTFLEFYNLEDPELCESVKLVRKGLMRVFELKIDYLLQEQDSLSVKGKIMAQKDWNIRNYIVGEAYGILDSKIETHDDLDSENKAGPGSCIELWHYVQTDGINVQISWWSDLNCWSIGSYNVSILVASIEDLKKYPGYGKKVDKMKKHEIRYNYCIHIAKSWFRILEDLKEIETEEDLQNEMFLALENCTLVGELVGIDSIQQILSYPSESLIFSSMIDNTKPGETWMPPEKWINFCQRWKLSWIPITQVGLFNTQEILEKSMLKLYHKVTTGPIYEYEEGVIMMLVHRNPAAPEEDRVLSWSKIKTIEYKVFKKVKDKLKNYWENYEKVTYITKKMEKEYKTKFDRFKTEVNDIFKAHLSVDSKYRKSKQSADLVSHFGAKDFNRNIDQIWEGCLRQCHVRHLPVQPHEIQLRRVLREDFRQNLRRRQGHGLCSVFQNFWLRDEI